MRPPSHTSSESSPQFVSGSGLPLGSGEAGGAGGGGKSQVKSSAGGEQGRGTGTARGNSGRGGRRGIAAAVATAVHCRLPVPGVLRCPPPTPLSPASSILGSRSAICDSKHTSSCGGGQGSVCDRGPWVRKCSVGTPPQHASRTTPQPARWPVAARSVPRTLSQARQTTQVSACSMHAVLLYRSQTSKLKGPAAAAGATTARSASTQQAVIEARMIIGIVTRGLHSLQGGVPAIARRVVCRCDGRSLGPHAPVALSCTAFCTAGAVIGASLGVHSTQHPCLTCYPAQSTLEQPPLHARPWRDISITAYLRQQRHRQ